MSAKTIRLAVQGDRGTDTGSDAIESIVVAVLFAGFGSLA